MSTRGACAPQTRSQCHSQDALQSTRRDSFSDLLLQQFARFRHREKFIEAVQPRKVIAFRAIEKTLLPHVNVEKSQQWAKWQVLRKGFQFSAPVDRPAADFL